MNDDVDKQGENTTGEGDGPVGGERLAEARREQQISVLEIAKELHLDEHKGRALERNEFDVLGAPVFAKGHLKKYSQLVGVNADDVMADGGSCVAMPTGQVFKWHFRIIRQPIVNNAAVPKPNSSAPRVAANRIS